MLHGRPFFKAPELHLQCSVGKAASVGVLSVMLAAVALQCRIHWAGNNEID